MDLNWGGGELLYLSFPRKFNNIFGFTDDERERRNIWTPSNNNKRQQNSYSKTLNMTLKGEKMERAKEVSRIRGGSERELIFINRGYILVQESREEGMFPRRVEIRAQNLI